MTWSVYIERLAANLRAEGVVVDLYASLPPGIVGRFHYPDAAEPDTQLRIDIDEPCAREALLTLAHEAGHFRAWKLGGPHGEPEAIHFGWLELESLGAPVTRAEWDAFHQEAA